MRALTRRGTIAGPRQRGPEAGGSLKLPAPFWKRFAKESWDRGPKLFEGHLRGLLPTADEIYAVLLAATERARAGDRSILLRMYLEHQSAAARGDFFVSELVAPLRYLPES